MNILLPVVLIDVLCIIVLGLFWFFFTQTISFARRMDSPEEMKRHRRQAAKSINQAQIDIANVQREIMNMHYDVNNIFGTRAVRKQYSKKLSSNKHRLDEDFFEFFDNE